jgi:DNA-binding NtrC family response regulator
MGAPETDIGRTVLVVDDEERIRILVGEMLRLAGYQIVLAGGAEEAEWICRNPSAHIDLLLTDLRMPGTDGRALAAKLSAAMPDLKVIYMTGYAGEETCPPDVLAKPFRFADLLHKVAAALGTLQPAASH